MRKVIKNIMTSLVLVISGVFFSTAIAAHEFSGNWTKIYNLKDGHYVEHTPTYVSLDGVFRSGRSLRLNRVIINGTRFDNVYLDTDSTREEFNQAVRSIVMTKVY